ncbi:MAG: 2-oxoacid:acceptor oxidoreductase family protein [Rubrivivax sp.]|nr:2-oxoacid:acceptor oxidoreductase family protein [Rubrivivax sp.]
MLQIVIQGRGGQGAQTAGNLLAAAFFAAGHEVQCFASYGGARRGTPVNSYLRVDERPIRLRCDIQRADAILCFDASLLTPPLLALADARTLIVVNAPRRPSGETLAGRHVVAVDGLTIARRHGLGRIVNAALAGGLARALNTLPLPVLQAALQTTLQTRAQSLQEANSAACADGWAAVDALLQEEATP